MAYGRMGSGELGERRERRIGRGRGMRRRRGMRREMGNGEGRLKRGQWERDSESFGI